jgi:hypothetical protein
MGQLACSSPEPDKDGPKFLWPGQTWPVSTPEAEGIDPAAIDSLVADIGKGEYGLVDHFLPQFLQVVPEYDLVAVFNGWNIHGDADQSTWRALQERILPAAK